MAIWQYTFQVLLKESADALSPDLIFTCDDDGFDDELFWKLHPVNKSFFSKIDNLLGVMR